MEFENWAPLIATDPVPMMSTDPAEDTWLDHTFTLKSVDRPYASFMAWIRADGRVEIRSRVEMPEPYSDAECSAIHAVFGGLLARVRKDLALPFIVAVGESGGGPGRAAFDQAWKDSQRLPLWNPPGRHT